MMDEKIDPGSYRDSVRHHAAKSNTLGNSPILRIIVTGIGNLQTCYRCLDVRKRLQEAWATNGLRMFQPANGTIEQVALPDGGTLSHGVV